MLLEETKEFYDLINGDPAYLDFVKKYYTITLKHFDKQEKYPYAEIDDPVYEYYNVLLYFYTRLNPFKRKYGINYGSLSYNCGSWSDNNKKIQEIINRQTKILLHNSINFLPIIKLSELDRNKLYLILHQEIGNNLSKNRYSNFVRYKDYVNYKPSKFTFNHIALMFFHDMLQQWYILEYVAEPTLTRLSIYLDNNKSAVIYSCQLDKINLNKKDKDKLYHKMKVYGQKNEEGYIDKKYIKLNVLKFGLSQSFSCYEYHFSGAKDWRSIIDRNWKKILNKKRDLIAVICQKLGFESKKRNICSKYVMEIIKELNQEYWIESNKYGQKILSSNFTPKDVLNLVIYKDDKTFEDGVKVLIKE